jgi:hypothetical protein
VMGRRPFGSNTEPQEAKLSLCVFPPDRIRDNLLDYRESW